MQWSYWYLNIFHFELGIRLTIIFRNKFWLFILFVCILYSNAIWWLIYWSYSVTQCHAFDFATITMTASFLHLAHPRFYLMLHFDCFRSKWPIPRATDALRSLMLLLGLCIQLIIFEFSWCLFSSKPTWPQLWP